MDGKGFLAWPKYELGRGGVFNVRPTTLSLKIWSSPKSGENLLMGTTTKI